MEKSLLFDPGSKLRLLILLGGSGERTAKIITGSPINTELRRRVQTYDEGEKINLIQSQTFQTEIIPSCRNYFGLLQGSARSRSSYTVVSAREKNETNISD